MKMLFDMRYALRLLVKNPGFSVLTILVMATGLGLSTFMYGFLNAILFRPLPFTDGEQMYVVDLRIGEINYNGNSLSLHDADEIRSRAESFAEAGVFYEGTANLSTGDRAQRYTAAFTDVKMLDYTGVKPELGRRLQVKDGVKGAPKVVVISHEIWQQVFSGREDVLGLRTKVNGDECEIVGVMPKGFRFPVSSQLWLPNQIDLQTLERSSGPGASLFVKLKAGVSLEQANADVERIMADIAKRYPATNKGYSAYVDTFQASFMGTGTEMIVMVIVMAVIFILALACINVGNLLLVRSTERAKETAIRAALGAPRYRLVMQMMWESLFICFAGALIAILINGYAGELNGRVLAKILPVELPYWIDTSLDAEMVLATLGIAVLTTLLTSFVPAWKLLQGNFNDVLRDGTRGARSRRNARLHHVLVIMEVALSCALMSLSAVLVMLLAEANGRDYGTDREGMLTARLALPAASYESSESRARFFQVLVGELKDIHGVDAAGAVSSLPGSGAGLQKIHAQDVEVVNDNYPRAGDVAVFPGSLQAIGARLLEGRWLNEGDRAGSQAVAVISNKLARQLWPNESALGKRIQWIEGEDGGQWVNVVGVIEHIIHSQPYQVEKSTPAVYRSQLQAGRRLMNIFVRSDSDPELFREAVTRAIAKIDPEVPPYEMMTLSENLARRTGGMNYLKNTFTLFAFAALLLASTGIYGVLANNTAQRTQEIGVRRAIGATDSRIMTMLMKQGWFYLGLGFLFGLPAGYVLSIGFVQLLGSDSQDWLWMFVLIPLVISAVVNLATWLPARRAIRIEPHVALRYE